MTGLHQNTAQAAGTVTEYGVRFTVIGGSITDRQLKRRTHIKVCGRSRTGAAMELERVRTWQDGNPLCPEVDAVLISRTLIVSEWADASGGDA